MYDIALVEPSLALEIPALEYRQEHIDYGETWIHGSSGFMLHDSYDEWIKKLEQVKEAETSYFHVPATTYFSIRKEDNKIIGTIQLRHFLTPELEKSGGHIGYGIRPTERKKGYGKQQLTLVLAVAKQMKIPQVMITCDKNNVASRETALHCGGILTGEILYEGKVQQIIWIDLR